MDKFMREYVRLAELNPHWRYGQTLFNALDNTHPELAALIRGSYNDPFHYEPGRTHNPLPGFWERVMEDLT